MHKISKYSKYVVWLGGFATGVQFLVYLVSGGVALMVAAFVFLFERPLPFRVAVFVGLSLILFAVFNHLLGLFLAWRKGRSSTESEDPTPESTLPDTDPHHVQEAEIKQLETKLDEAEQEREQLQASLREAKQERDELRAENEELTEQASSPDVHQETRSAFIAEYATGTEKFPPPQPLPTDAGSRSNLSGLSFRFTDLVRGDVLRGKSFDRCTIHGPALITPRRSSQHDCTFTGNPDSVFWEVELGSYKQGLILVEDCVFTRCTFIRMGMAGIPEDVRQWKAVFEEPPGGELTSL